MIRDHWREFAFWRWWWGNRVSSGTKVVLGVFVLAGIVAAGWFASGGLTSARADSSKARTVIRTVELVVTVHEQDKPSVKRIPEVRTVYVANAAHAGTTTVRVASTSFLATTIVRTVAAPATRTASAPMRTRTVTRTVTKTLPKVEWRMITIVQKVPVTVTVTTTAP